MSADTFGQRLNRWKGSTKPTPVITPPPALYETIARHANPLGMLDWSKRAHPHSMPVGVDRHHRLIYTKAETSKFDVGPARALGGKSASGTVPALIEHSGSAVVMSLREDAVAATAAMRSLKGQLTMFDPDGTGIHDGVGDQRWSLLVGAEVVDRSVTVCTEFITSANIIKATGGNVSENPTAAAARVLGCSWAWVFVHRHVPGLLPAVQVGRRWPVDVDSDAAVGHLPRAARLRDSAVDRVAVSDPGR